MTGRLVIRKVLIVGVLFQLSTPWPASAGGRMNSELACAPADAPLTVHCTIELTQGVSVARSDEHTIISSR